MTLEEAINYYERQTEELYNAIPCDGCAFNMCKEEHRQLVEWLRELKAYREAEEEIDRKRKSGQWSDAVVFGMGKALWIMHKHIREVNADES